MSGNSNFTTASDRKVKNYALDKSERAKKAEKTAINKFNKFLSEYYNKEDPVRCPYTHIDQITDPLFFGEETIGAYTPYLHEIDGMAKNTTDTYLSHLKMFVIRKFPNQDTSFFEHDRYSQLRRNTGRRFIDHHAKAGTKVVQHAVKMSPRDLSTFSEFLFAYAGGMDGIQGLRYPCSIRCLLLLQWHAFGRIVEIASLKWSQIGYHDGTTIKTLKFDLNRFKVGTQQENMLFFPHESTWVRCPLHALATMIAVDSPIGSLFGHVFGNDAGSGASAFVNNALKVLTNSATDEGHYITPGLTSHSLRSGSATSCSENKELQTHHLNHRGCWDGVSTLFTYIWGTESTDAAVGRVLSGWSSISRGGDCPVGSSLVPQLQKSLYQRYCIYLMGAAGIGQLVQDVLTSILILYYLNVREKYPAHPLIIKMTSFVGVDHDMLVIWNAQIREWFVRYNGAYSSIQSLDDNNTVQVWSVKECFDEAMKQSAHTADNMARYGDALQSMTLELKAANERIERMENGMARLLQLAENGQSSSSSAEAVGRDINTVLMATQRSNLSGSKRSRQVRSEDDRSFDKQIFKDNVGALFYAWYTKELYLCKENADLLRAARLMTRLKALLPPGTKIVPKPTNVARLQAWTADITALSCKVLERAKEFCDWIKANDGQARKRKKKCQGKVYGTEVVFNLAHKANFNLNATVDLVTPNHLQIEEFHTANTNVDSDSEA